MKICTKCKTSLSEQKFFKSKYSKDGLSYQCKECLRNSRKLYREQNKMKEKRINAEWYFNNRESVLKKTREYSKKKRKVDPSFRKADIYRGRLSSAFLKGYYSEDTEEVLGCSLEHLKKHLQSLFKPGMSWENKGRWQIDHIKPCRNFDLTDREQLKQCFHYTNLQPLWKWENELKH